MTTSPEAAPNFVVKMRLVTARVANLLAPLVFLLGLSIVLSLTSKNFATRENLKQIAVQAAVVAILACGQTAGATCRFF